MSSSYADHIIDSIYAVVYAVNYDTHEIIYANNVVKRIFPDYREGAICYQCFFDREAPCPDCPLHLVARRLENMSIVMWVEKLKRWAQLAYNDCASAEGTHYCVCTGVDITAIKASIHMTERVLDGIHAAAYTVGVNDHKIRSVNQELRNMLPEIKQGDLCYSALWDNQEPCSYCPLPKLSEKNPFEKLELYNKKLKRFLSIDSVWVKGISGDPLVIFTGYDITQRIEYEDRLKNIAYNDTQLGIKNYVAFMDDLAAFYQTGKSGFACIMNFKNFNSYNVIYGRAQGDILLQSLSAFYTAQYPKERFFRVGGSKFAFIAQDETEYQALLRLVSRKIPQDILGNNTTFLLYTDAVMLEFPRFAPQPEMVIHNAEYLLQKTKKVDSSEIFYFQRPQQEKLERNRQIALTIRRKLNEHAFMVYFQPIYDIKLDRFEKCEALLRLYDRNLGWVSPAEFIPVAEESGLINELGMFVLAEACQLISSRKARGLSPVQINVNVSSVQFSKSTFYDDVISVVEKYDIDTHLIQLEVTESITINSFEYILTVMQKLMAHGFSFAIDDFGTGYSSLSYVGALPVESIKLDKRFVDKVVGSDVYVLIVKNVIEIAKGLHFTIVAEGVESPSQFELLKRLGCDYIQGFLFSKPLPKEDFELFLETERPQCPATPIPRTCHSIAKPRS